MPKQKKRLVLVDGNALIHRAYHALPPLTTKKGELVNAVYGFTTLLLKAIADLKPEYVAVAFDLAGPTFRHETYKDYKATRVKAPDDLYAQFDRVKEIVRTLNIPIFEVAGFEADDVIGTLSSKAYKQGIETIIVTGDMDTLQLVNHAVKIYTMRRGLTDTALIDAEAVEERYGLSPEQFVDYKALKGDPSDNIKGVAGIGEKTAAALVQVFGSLDRLYAYLEKNDSSSPTGKPKAGQDRGSLGQAKGRLSSLSAPLSVKDDKMAVKITPRIKRLLLEGKEQAYQSRHLSEIVCDVPIELDLAAATLKDYNRQKAIELFQELEFRSLLPRLPAPRHQPARGSQTSIFGESKTISSQVTGKDYCLVNDERQFEALLSKLAKAKEFALDTETDYLNGPIIGLSFATAEGEAFYIPLNMSSPTGKPKAGQDRGSLGQAKGRLSSLSAPLSVKDDMLKRLKPILEDPKINKIGHNMKYDWLTLRKEGVTVAPLYFDTMIASYLLNPANRQHNLDAVAFVELGIEKIPLAQLIGEKKLDSVASVPVETVAEYAAEDADIALRLYHRFKGEIEEHKLHTIFYELEMPLSPILGVMEEAGVKIDTDYLATVSLRLTKRQEELTRQIYHQAGGEFNINSTQQLSTILFDKLQLTHPDLKKTKTGISTAASELEKMRGLHPIIDLLSEYRELTKLLSTYIDALPKLVAADGRLHTSFNQTVAATGRLSSSEPNLQNIPIRTELGRQIRKAFVAEESHQLVCADYSQIELRVVAHLSSDKALIEAFEADRDIHQEVAERLGVDRRVGKTLNFAVLYGQGPYSTAAQLGIPMHQAKDYIDRYFKTYKGVRQYLDEVLAQARTEGYLETIFGRRRYIPELHSANFTVRSAAERIATNMPIQGTAADIMKMAMIKICRDSDIVPQSGARIILQVHDELVFEVPKGAVETFGKAVKQLMESVYELKVPLKCEVKVGDNWGETRPL